MQIVHGGNDDMGNAEAEMLEEVASSAARTALRNVGEMSSILDQDPPLDRELADDVTARRRRRG